MSDTAQSGYASGTMKQQTLTGFEKYAKNCARRVVLAYFSNPVSVCCFIAPLA